jgi:hypothetical protein
MTSREFYTKLAKIDGMEERAVVMHFVHALEHAVEAYDIQMLELRKLNPEKHHGMDLLFWAERTAATILPMPIDAARRLIMELRDAAEIR